MPTYHLLIWDWSGIDYQDPRYIHYPPLLIQHGLVGKVLEYIESRYDGPVFPPRDKERSKKVDGWVLGGGGMAYVKGKWGERKNRWRMLTAGMEIEVDEHDGVSGALQRAIRHAERKGHPEWVMVQAPVHCMIFKKETAEELIAHIEENREELDAWGQEYRDAFNANLGKLNNHPNVLVGARGAPTPGVLSKGPGGEH